MNLAISNLAWPKSAEPYIFSFLKNLGVDGVEVAPTRIAPWGEFTWKDLQTYRAQVEAAGLAIPALQAIFYGKQHLQLLRSSDVHFQNMVDHTVVVAYTAQMLGAKVLVFGAPKNRLRGSMSWDSAARRAVERLRILGDVAAFYGLMIGVEPVPEDYGGDFMLNAAEVWEVVKLTGHKNVQVHLDTGCAFLAWDNIDQVIYDVQETLVHFHISEPQLAGFDYPVANHFYAAQALRDIAYNDWVSIEMKEQQNYLQAIEAAVRFARKVYG